MADLTKHLGAGVALTHVRSATSDPSGNSEGMEAQRDGKAQYKTRAIITKQVTFVFSACYS